MRVENVRGGEDVRRRITEVQSLQNTKKVVGKEQEEQWKPVQKSRRKFRSNSDSWEVGKGVTFCQTLLCVFYRY